MYHKSVNLLTPPPNHKVFLWERSGNRRVWPRRWSIMTVISCLNPRSKPSYSHGTKINENKLIHSDDVFRAEPTEYPWFQWPIGSQWPRIAASRGVCGHKSWCDYGVDRTSFSVSTWDESRLIQFHWCVYPSVGTHSGVCALPHGAKNIKKRNI